MSRVETSPPSETLGHLAYCEIDGLFGSHSIKFATATDGPTLLYGKNGTGKSTVLGLIDDVAHLRWARVLKRPFARIVLSFQGGDRLFVSREGESIAVSFRDDVWQPSRDEIAEALHRDELRRQRALTNPRAPRTRQESLFDQDDLDARFHWLFQIPRLFPVFLIEDQRLIAAPRGPRIPGDRADGGLQAAVSRFVAELRSEMQGALSVYASQSQELDRRFPVRIAQAVEGGQGQTDVSLEQIRGLMAQVEQERSLLQDVGLLGKEEGPVAFDSSRLETPVLRPVIQTFAEDTLAKFAVLRDLRIRLELFTRFLNRHYQDKLVATSRENGFTIYLEDGQRLQANQLSSGEQQILALAFRILFRSQPGTLILIDEPELSLHVLWQATLIDDLSEMGRIRDVTFLLATHSPTLIGNRVELMRSLDQAEPDGMRQRGGHSEIAGLDEQIDDASELEPFDVESEDDESE
jgi:ABC-type thiamine transport system ATPase subunit